MTKKQCSTLSMVCDASSCSRSFLLQLTVHTNGLIEYNRIREASEARGWVSSIHGDFCPEHRKGRHAAD